MLPSVISDLIDSFSSLPGIGTKSATRIVLDILNGNPTLANKLSADLKGIHEKIRRCVECNNYSEGELCNICNSESRNKGTLLVIENFLDLEAIESTNYNGHYYLLGKLISPLQGISPEDVGLEKLVHKISKLIKESNSTKNELEIILALPTSMEGEATNAFILQLLEENNLLAKCSVSKIARGLPSNSSVEYQDSETLKTSLEFRSKIS